MFADSSSSFSIILVKKIVYNIIKEVSFLTVAS